MTTRAIKLAQLALTLTLLSSTVTAVAGDSTRTAVGSAIGGGVGAVIGREVGGDNGAIVGAAVGGAAGGAVSAQGADKTGAAIGGAIGGASGAVVGGHVGGANGEVIGAAAGAAAGGVIGGKVTRESHSQTADYGYERYPAQDSAGGYTNKVDWDDNDGPGRRGRGHAYGHSKHHKHLKH